MINFLEANKPHAIQEKTFQPNFSGIDPRNTIRA